MKATAECTQVMIALLWIGVSSTATANLSLIDTYTNTPENTPHIVAVASARLGYPNLISLLRLEDLTPAPSGSSFAVTYPTSNTADISWNLNDSGFDLMAVYIFGGNGANLYKVTDAAQMISGSAIIHPPVTGNSGSFAGISHILFLGVAVPEPSSVVLFALGSATGLLAWRLCRR